MSVWRGLVLLAVYSFCWISLVSVVYGWQGTRDWEGELKDLSEMTDTEAKLRGLEQLRLAYIQEIGSDGPLYGKLCHSLATTFGRHGQFTRSFELFGEALEGHRHPSSADPSMLVNTFFNLAYFHLESGLKAEFLLYADSCTRYSEQYPLKQSIGVHMHELLAAYYYDAGDYSNSLANAEKGILLAQKEDTFVGLLYLQVAQAKLAQRDGDDRKIRLDVAFKSLSEAKRILGHSPELTALIKSVEANYDLFDGRLESARSNYERSIQLYLEQGDFEGAVRNYIKLGDLFSEYFNDTRSSERIYQEGLRTLDKVNRVDLKPILLNKIALLALKKKDYPAAITYLKDAILGLRISGASADSRRLVTDSTELYSNDLLAEEFFANLGRAYAGNFHHSLDSLDLKVALQHFKSALAAMDRVRWSHAYDQSKLYWRSQAKTTFTHALDVCYQLHDVETAFFFFEKSRAVLLQDKLNDLEARKYLSAAQIDREKQLKLELASLYMRLSEEKEGTDAHQQVYRDILRLREAQRIFISELESSHLQYVEAKYGAKVVDFMDLNASLQAMGISYLAYFNGVGDAENQPHIYVMALNGAATKLLKIPLGSYHEDVREFLELTSARDKLNRQFDRFQELSYQLFQKLVHPLGPLHSRLMVSPDDQLVPFDLLLSDRSRAGSYLLLDHAVSYTYSAGFIDRSGRGVRAVKPTLLGFAPVSYQEHLGVPSLVGADFSLSRFQQFLSGCEFFIHEKATKEQFLTQIYEHPMVVLYTHAESGDEGEEGNLYFHDEKLSVSDLLLVDPLPTELIILSACNTGVGKNRPGEGVFSLARGFAAAGIPTSVTTLWEIDSRATYTLTETFYGHVVAGLPLDVALQKAKLAMLQGKDPMHVLPYYWGGSIVMGSVQPLEFDKSGSITHRFWLAGGLALLFYLLVGYRKGNRKQ